MLTTNSKKAKQNLRQYILDNFDGGNYGIEKPETFEEAAKIILETFKNEKFYSDRLIQRRQLPMNVVFADWCAGLPSILNTGYYLGTAVDDLGEILEETETERNRYNQDEAEKLLTLMIWRELNDAR